MTMRSKMINKITNSHQYHVYFHDFYPRHDWEKLKSVLSFKLKQVWGGMLACGPLLTLQWQDNWRYLLFLMIVHCPHDICFLGVDAHLPLIYEGFVRISWGKNDNYGTGGNLSRAGEKVGWRYLNCILALLFPAVYKVRLHWWYNLKLWI